MWPDGRVAADPREQINPPTVRPTNRATVRLAGWLTRGVVAMYIHPLDRTPRKQWGGIENGWTGGQALATSGHRIW